MVGDSLGALPARRRRGARGRGAPGPRDGRARRGPPGEARRQFQAAAAIATRLGRHDLLGAAQQSLGLLWLEGGDLVRARAVNEAALGVPPPGDRDRPRGRADAPGRHRPAGGRPPAGPPAPAGDARGRARRRLPVRGLGRRRGAGRPGRAPRATRARRGRATARSSPRRAGGASARGGARPDRAGGQALRAGDPEPVARLLGALTPAQLTRTRLHAPYAVPPVETGLAVSCAALGEAAARPSSPTPARCPSPTLPPTPWSPSARADLRLSRPTQQITRAW